MPGGPRTGDDWEGEGERGRSVGSSLESRVKPHLSLPGLVACLAGDGKALAVEPLEKEEERTLEICAQLAEQSSKVAHATPT